MGSTRPLYLSFLSLLCRASALMKQPVAVCALGRVEYEATWGLQRRLQQRLIAAKRAEPPEAVPHVLLLVEHPHVFTLGKSGERAHLLADETHLSRLGATFVPVDRGGDITYHGPGQLVVYPVFDLGRFFTDIHRYLRTLEEAVVLTCADYGLAAGRVAGRTGVWIEAGTERERKVCAFGVRCSRWVTMHGLALNLNTDLSYFGHIVPCGIADRGVTSRAAEPGRPVNEDEAAGRLLGHLADGFGLRLTHYTRDEAHRFFDAFGVTSDAVSV